MWDAVGTENKAFRLNVDKMALTFVMVKKLLTDSVLHFITAHLENLKKDVIFFVA